MSSKAELFIEECEMIGRSYRNAFNMDEIITLPAAYWDYVDWLVANGIDIQEWIVECDKHRGDISLSDNFWYWLWWDECDRHRQGWETPTKTPPRGYQEF